MARLLLIESPDVPTVATVLRDAGHDLVFGTGLDPIDAGSTENGLELIVVNGDVAESRLARLVAPPRTGLIVTTSVPPPSLSGSGDVGWLVSPADPAALLTNIRTAVNLTQSQRARSRLNRPVPASTDPAVTALAGRPLADVERQVILSTLQQFKGHRLKTAGALGIGVRTLGIKLKRWRDEGRSLDGVR